MIEQPSNTHGTQPETGDSAGVGMLLRASRQRVGEDLRDVAAMLRIRYPYLEAIEEGRHTALPGQTYAIGFVRAYAEHLGLDSEEVVRRYKAEIASRGGRHDLHFPTPMAETGIPGGAIVFVGLMVAVLVYGGWYLSTAEDGFLSDLVAPLPERLAALVSRASGPEKEQPPAKPAGETQPAPATTVELKPATTSAAEPAKAEPSQPTPATPAAAGTEAKPEPEKVPEKAPEKALEATAEASPQKAPEPAAMPAADTPAATAPAPAPATPPTATPAAPTPPPVSQPAPKPVMAEPTPKPADIPPAAAASAPAPTPAPTTPAPAAATTPAIETVALPAPPVETKPSRIIVKATANSWIEVQDDFSNTTLVSRMLHAGESYEVPDKTGLSLLTGNAGALEIVVDGTKAPSIGGNGAVRRGVQLIPELLKAGTATQ